jgi:hypothetical protein
MEPALKVLNELERRGLIERYAIGGGIAALFYMEPLLTFDLDVLVFLPETQGKLITMSPIYEDLRQKGYRAQKETVTIEGIPVQRIPAYNPLVEEAVREATEQRYRKTLTRVARVEHLLAIMLQTGRAKDVARMTQLLEEAKVDQTRLTQILDRHGLREKWRQFRKRFYGG